MTVPRKGHSKIADIPEDLLDDLNAGTVPSASLSEGLAVDFSVLLRTTFPELPPEAFEAGDGAMSLGVTRRMEAFGEILLLHRGIESLPSLIAHPSDTVRGWACYMIGLTPKLRLKERLDLLRPLADDAHFGVREWAWIPMRRHISMNVRNAVAALKPWTKEKSVNLRRYAVEATRPRGVWATHIEQLKHNPEMGLPLLEPLKADPEKYVQDSVGNWLNDAAKSQSEWVSSIVSRWRQESSNAATERICDRAMRSVSRRRR